MNKAMRRSAVVLGFASVLFLSGCSDDDPDTVLTETVTETASASAAPSASPTGREAATQPVHLVCPDPVGEVDALTSSGDEWGAAYVNDSDTVLWPVAFGESKGTTSGGDTWTDAPKTNPSPAADPADAIECSFTGTFTGKDESGEVNTVDVEGTISVVVE